MATEITIRPAEPADAYELAAHMRASDVREVMASHGHVPLRALRISLSVSWESYAATADGKILALFGVAGLLDVQPGSPWMLAAEGFPFGRTRECMRIARHTLRRWTEMYGLLFNMVDVRNTTSIRWLKKLGASFETPVPYGPDALPFVRFEFRRY